MNAQWRELKDWIEEQQVEIKTDDFRMFYEIVFTKIQSEMNRIESEYACKSLEEAGY